MSADRRTYSTGSYQKLENGKYRLFVSGGTGLGRKRVRRTKTVQARKGMQCITALRKQTQPPAIEGISFRREVLFYII